MKIGVWEAGKRVRWVSQDQEVKEAEETLKNARTKTVDDYASE